MASETSSVVLDVQVVDDLSRHFSHFRHDVNGCLSLIVAATELIRYNPDVVKRMAITLMEQPPRIAGKMVEFLHESERALGLREEQPNWHAFLWQHGGSMAVTPTAAICIEPDHAKSLHQDLLQLGKELTQLGFNISGIRVLATAHPMLAEAPAETTLAQLVRVAERFDAVASKVELALGLGSQTQRRLASGRPSGPVSLSADEISLFHRKLLNLQQDILEHLRPLLELAQLAQTDPQQVQTRAAEFARQPPLISDEISNFSLEFDRTFGILRTADS